jgi:integrase
MPPVGRLSSEADLPNTTPPPSRDVPRRAALPTCINFTFERKPMPVAKLDAQFCLLAQCQPGKKKTDYYDETIKGFVLETRPRGKSFYLRYVDPHGRQKQHRIAGYGDATFDKIKKEAQRLRSEITLGGDPAAKKAEKKAIPTYAELARKHLDFVKGTARSYDTIEGYMRRHILPQWGKRRVSEITQPDVAKWLAEMEGGRLAPASILKVRILFNRSFELALRWNMPGVTRNPVKGIPHKPINNARERYLTADEVTHLLAACDASANPQLGRMVRLLLYTGARLSELLNAEWQHIDLDKRQWLIPHTKNGRSRKAALSQAAIEVLNAAPRYEKCPYVVPNPETKLPFVSVKHSWQTARYAAGLPGLRLHDLRHACATFLAGSGVDLLTIGRQRYGAAIWMRSFRQSG